ncbi:josephin protein [Cystoisospora suis]|uniref:Josephin protein n=1 Tax=Cystoisospora suis TaxID=483139 RepID=A0A2C6L7C6_9APIC|nr:josephin protein [Cystoisospora suis]
MHQKAREKEAEDAKKAGENGEEGGRSFLALAPRGKRDEHSWPTDGGYRLDGSSCSSSTSSSGTPLTGASSSVQAPSGSGAVVGGGVDVDIEEDDPELREALRLSLETYKQEMKAPPEEPPADAEDICTVVVRLRNGEKVTRRFRKADTMEQVFQWAEYEASQQLPVPSFAGSSCVLVQTVPKRKFCKLSGHISLCEGDTEGISIKGCDLQELGFQRREQLMMTQM